ncbi:hypothetical protein V8E55_003247 [Tylopilus felleus]
MCANGGDLWRCDLCVRSVCKICIAIRPEDLLLVAQKDIKFLCLACHLMDDMRTKVVLPYMLSHKSIIQALVTIFLYFRLKSLPVTGPIIILINSLRPYFVHSGGLVSKEVPFDIGTEGKWRGYQKKALEIIKKCVISPSAFVIVAISTHSDEDCGNLFAGHDGNREMAVEIQEFLDILLGLFGDITKGATLYMLSCGQYICHSNSRLRFSKAIAKLFSRAIAFDACRFHPSTASAFLVALTDQVVIQCHAVEDAIPVALDKSNDLNRHSDGKTMETARYLLYHQDYRPWGKNIPVQCSTCGVVPKKWKQKDMQGGYLYECPNPDCAGNGMYRGPHIIEVIKPRGVVRLSNGKTKNSAWMKKYLCAIHVESIPQAL